MSAAYTAALRAYCNFYEQLTPQRIGDLERLVTRDVRFRDPFNDVTGVAEMRRIFEHMYRQCPDARFRVLHSAIHQRTGYVHWRFHCRGVEIDGLSQVQFSGDGRVAAHIDYWDPAFQLYERVPVLGWVLRRVRRRLSAGQ